LVLPEIVVPGPILPALQELSDLTRPATELC
jgi:hypothetical protein